MLGDTGLSEWQIGFLAVALDEVAEWHERMGKAGTIACYECADELTQMNSQHRASIEPVVYALTGLSFSVSWRGDYGARTFFVERASGVTCGLALISTPFMTIAAGQRRPQAGSARTVRYRGYSMSNDNKPPMFGPSGVFDPTTYEPPQTPETQPNPGSPKNLRRRPSGCTGGAVHPGQPRGLSPKAVKPSA